MPLDLRSIANYETDKFLVKNVTNGVIVIADLKVRINPGETVNLFFQDPFTKRRLRTREEVFSSRSLELELVSGRAVLLNSDNTSQQLSLTQSLNAKDYSTDLTVDNVKENYIKYVDISPTTVSGIEIILYQESIFSSAYSGTAAAFNSDFYEGGGTFAMLFDFRNINTSNVFGSNTTIWLMDWYALGVSPGFYDPEVLEAVPQDPQYLHLCLPNPDNLNTGHVLNIISHPKIDAAIAVAFSEKTCLLPGRDFVVDPTGDFDFSANSPITPTESSPYDTLPLYELVGGFSNNKFTPISSDLKLSPGNNLTTTSDYFVYANFSYTLVVVDSKIQGGQEKSKKVWALVNEGAKKRHVTTGGYAVGYANIGYDPDSVI